MRASGVTGSAATDEPRRALCTRGVIIGSDARPNWTDRGSGARLSRHLTDLRSTPHRRRRWPLLARPHVVIDEPFRVLREVLVGIESALYYLVGDVLRHIARPALGGVEGDD